MKLINKSLLIFGALTALPAFADGPDPLQNLPTALFASAAVQTAMAATEHIQKVDNPQDQNFGGHKGRAIELLREAQREIVAAALFSQGMAVPPGPHPMPPPGSTYASLCVASIENPGPSDIYYCGKIQNPYALACVRTVGRNASPSEIYYCASIRTPAEANCVASVGRDASPSDIYQCSGL